MEGISAPSGYDRTLRTGRHYTVPVNPTEPRSIEEAKAVITSLLREQGAIREKLWECERLYKEMSEAYAELKEDYLAAKKIALRMLNNRSKRC